jgi:hypothetical protein
MSLLDKLFPGNSATDPAPETEPIVGYRCWKFRESPEGIPILYSVVQDFCWPPFEAARGDVSDDGGIYAVKSIAEVWKYLDGDCISGSVNLWGTVMEHPEGFRAEYAYPKELWVQSDFDAAMIMRIEETYGVPVVIKEDIPKPSIPEPMQFTSSLSHGVMELLRDVVYDREAIHGSYMHIFCLPQGQMSYGVDGQPFMKDHSRTNMVMACQLQPPNRFVIKSIRCAFFEADGSPVPVNDPIYWEATVCLRLNRKFYWDSLAAFVADPAILMAGTDWSKIPAPERLQLIDALKAKVTSGPTAFPGNVNISSIDGVAIEQQQHFDVEIRNLDKWRDRREVLVALEGISGRAVL